MFKDMSLSKDLMISFKQVGIEFIRPRFKNSKIWVRQNARFMEQLQGLDMSVSVLTDGYWPTYPIVNITLPPGLAKSLEVFKGFYLGNHSGRKLTWLNSLGHCMLKADYPKVGFFIGSKLSRW
jgi:cullin-4